MDTTTQLLDAGGKLALAFLLSGLLGLERERKGRAAGLRTHIVVCLGSCLAVIVGNHMAFEWSGSSPAVPYDRGRIIAGILQGIGFIGAGTIINVGSVQRGLTTAAMVWFVGVVGITIALGYALIAVAATAFTLVAVILLDRVDDFFAGSLTQFAIEIEMPGGLQHTKEIERFVESHHYRVHASRMKVEEKGNRVSVRFDVSGKEVMDAQDLITALHDEFPVIEKITIER